jgi:hypothetical protein
VTIRKYLGGSVKTGRLISAVGIVAILGGLFLKANRAEFAFWFVAGGLFLWTVGDIWKNGSRVCPYCVSSFPKGVSLENAKSCEACGVSFDDELDRSRIRRTRKSG